MNRALLYSVVVVALLGVDLTANNGAVTRDLASAVVGAGKSTQHAVHATVGFMAGRR